MREGILLCADSESIKAPSLMGLGGEDIEGISWLACEAGATDCRERARSHGGFEEAWVVSCDDMEPINVAAAVKHDGFCKKVFLVSDAQNGSLASRAANAHIDGLWSEAAFVRHYAKTKAAFAGRAAVDTPRRTSSLGGDGALSKERLAEKSAAGVLGCASEKELPPIDVKGQAASALPPSFDELRSVSFDGARQGCEARDGSQPAFRPAKSDAPCPSPAPKAAYKAQGRPTKEGDATVVAVVAGSGGCGKSTLSAVFALMTARAGLRTAVLDADLQFGDLDYLLGAASPLRIEEITDDPARLANAAQPEGKPFLVAAPRKIEVSEAVAGEIPAVLSALKRSFDVVVVNTGALWADAHAGVLEAADAVAFVMDRRPSSLRATVHAVELCVRLGIATTGFTFVVNRHEKTSLLSAVDVSCALRGARAVELADGGRDVDELLGAGYPDELIGSKNAFIEGARALLADLLPTRRAEAVTGKATPKKRRSLFGKGGER